MLDADAISVAFVMGLVLDKEIEVFVFNFPAVVVLGTVTLIKSRKNCPPETMFVIVRVCSPAESCRDWKKRCWYWVTELWFPVKSTEVPLSML